MNKAEHLEPKTYTIDCSQPAGDNLLNVSELSKHIKEHLKLQPVGFKVLNPLSTKAEDGALVIVNSATRKLFNKRHLKYQVNKFLAIKQLRAFMKCATNGEEGIKIVYSQVIEDNEE